MRFLPLLSLLPFAAAAPLLAPRQGAELIPGKYIVVMKPDASQSAISQITDLWGDAVDHVYSIGTFKGVSGTLSQTLMTTIKNLGSITSTPALTEIETNATRAKTGNQSSGTFRKEFERAVAEGRLDLFNSGWAVAYVEQDSIVRTLAVTQSGAPWGLGRISHREKGSTDYVYDESAGQGTCSYVIDTGIFTGHPDFGGRATFLKNFAGDNLDADGNGHGTHVAGTIGSNTYGVAKKTSLFAVKVLNSSGTGENSGVLAGISFAAQDAKDRESKGECTKGSVGNLSLGGIFSTATMEAVRAAVNAGLFLAVAAGNSGLPDILFSPANEKSACTVGATDKDDKMASFSNFGALVDVLAPGVDIKSTWNDGNTNTISGTSMATPHVAGLGAYLLGLEQRRDPAALCKRIKDLSSKNKISNPGLFTVNYIAFNGVSA